MSAEGCPCLGHILLLGVSGPSELELHTKQLPKPAWSVTSQGRSLGLYSHDHFLVNEALLKALCWTMSLGAAEPFHGESFYSKDEGTR